MQTSSTLVFRSSVVRRNNPSPLGHLRGNHNEQYTNCNPGASEAIHDAR